MQRPARHSEKGFTLVEFLAAVIILSVGLLGLLAAVNLSLEANMGNKMRNDAVRLAEQTLANARSVPYANLATLPTPVTQNIQEGLSTVPFTITTNVAAMGGGTAATSTVTITVSWSYRGALRNHIVTTTISNTL